MTNKNIIKIKENNIAEVTKAFAKKAMIYGTEEYRLWRDFLSENPNYTMVTKTIKKNPNKETNKNLTFDNMRTFISEQENSDELLKEFEKQIRMSKIQSNPYRCVLAWFKTEFKNYDSYKEFFKKDENNYSNVTDVDFERKSVVNE